MIDEGWPSVHVSSSPPFSHIFLPPPFPSILPRVSLGTTPMRASPASTISLLSFYNVLFGLSLGARSLASTGEDRGGSTPAGRGGMGGGERYVSVPVRCERLRRAAGDPESWWIYRREMPDLPPAGHRKIRGGPGDPRHNRGAGRSVGGRNFHWQDELASPAPAEPGGHRGRPARVASLRR